MTQTALAVVVSESGPGPGEQSWPQETALAPAASVASQTLGAAGKVAVATGPETARHTMVQMAGTVLALAEEEVEPERFRGPQAVGPQGWGVAPGWCSAWTPARAALRDHVERWLTLGAEMGEGIGNLEAPPKRP